MTRIILDERHQYFDTETGEELVSVTRVIKMLGIRKSFHGVEPAILNFASERGKAVESILYDLIRGERASVDVPHWEQNGKTLRESVQKFLPGVQRWLNNGAAPYVSHQEIVCDLEAGIAGTLDLITASHIIDIKATAKEEVNWPIQLGAYASMVPLAEPTALAVLHINPKFAKGYIFREYDRDECLRKWYQARKAWIESRAAFATAKNAIINQEN